MRTLSEGTCLADRYTLIRRLGAGGSGEVWLAHDERLDTRIALKLLAEKFAADPHQRLLFNREWRIGSRLMHANIVRIFEYHDDAEGPFYGLQYVGETDIGVLTGIDPAESLRPVALIADALRYAHGKGVVHRDLKATNVLLDSRGLPYLVDFGVSDDSADAVPITGGGSDVASSPQQQSGAAAAAADDVFSLGVLIHELLTGMPPADGDVSKSLAGGAPIPSSIRQLLIEMLATDADKRPDAESVTARIAAAGIAAGPAPARFVSGASGVDESVARVEAIPRRHGVAAATSESTSSAESPGGISPSVLYGGLAVATLLFLVVIFVLPNLFDPKAPGTDQSPGEIETTVAPTAGDEVEPAVAIDSSTVPPEPPSAESNVSSDTSFSENIDSGGSTSVAQIKAETDRALGDLLSQLERLRFRAIDRWGGQEYLDALDVYAEGDQAYVDRNYRLAGEKYVQASEQLEPFFERIDSVFDETLAAARRAFDNSDVSEAVRLFDLATSITPGHREAEAGFARAKNLQAVLALMSQGSQYEDDLEFAAAKLAFEKVLELDPLWEPATAGLERVRAAIKQYSFEQRMTEGFDALFAADFDSARAAFNAAKALDPGSRQPVDGLLQLDQEVRLANIRRLEQEAKTLDGAEQWEASLVVYEDILKIDPDLQFAQAGLSMARSRSAMHTQLAALIAEPDGLSDQVTMQNATNLLLDVTRLQPIGPRLEDQKNELSRLLKRAATPVPVTLISDEQTNVAIFKVGKLGTFARQDLSLRPGVYVAVGNRAGYRDVRIEFRVAPEVEMQPIVILCEESI
ncbi:MAG: protein kinase domain-containing protein [Woeseiaceae bacterium]